MIAVSDALRGNLVGLGVGLAVLVALLLLAARAGLLQRAIDQFLLEGPAKRTTRSLVFGGFAIAIGGMLSAGAPMSETLRLAIRAVGSPLAKKRLEPVLHEVRQGESLSAALERVRGFPTAISRLAAVGEATGSLGGMLARAGRLEEETAIRRIEQVGQILGPALIVGLGGLVGTRYGQPAFRGSDSLGGCARLADFDFVGAGRARRGGVRKRGAALDSADRPQRGLIGPRRAKRARPSD
ncbi:type II secretion system F family protein [Caulobacter segnis]